MTVCALCGCRQTIERAGPGWTWFVLLQSQYHSDHDGTKHLRAIKLSICTLRLMLLGWLHQGGWDGWGVSTPGESEICIREFGLETSTENRSVHVGTAQIGHREIGVGFNWLSTGSSGRERWGSLPVEWRVIPFRVQTVR
jgi:hypothetical protein